MQKKYDQLLTILAEIADINTASGVLSWDQQTNMPKGGAETRATTMATLNRLSHEKFTADNVGELLSELTSWAEGLDPNSTEACLIDYTNYEYERSTKFPSEFIVKRTKTLAAANQSWQTARAEADFSKFQPNMEEVLDLVKEQADFFKPYDHIYDVLLNNFEREMTTTDVKAIFEAIREEHVGLIQAISEKPQVDDSFLHQHFPVEKQLAVGREIISQFGYDFDKGRQDAVHHPFATNLGYGDQRITYRADENFLNPYLFAIMHESGHAMYEQGIPKELWRTPLYRGTSSGIHESQSRLWENLVGRSEAFWSWYYPKLQDAFPSQLGNVKEKDFYNAVNRVEPSFIRVEADEATYNLHPLLRMEIEIDLLDGKFEVKDLPDVWNAKIQEYLGITPPDDAQGVLQDVHWSWGLYGHFITYALGNLIGSQIWEVMEKDIPDVSGQISQGDFKPLHSWLTENIYQHGRKYKPQELVKRITGNKINGQAYMRYLTKKFSGIYKL